MTERDTSGAERPSAEADLGLRAGDTGRTDSSSTEARRPASDFGAGLSAGATDSGEGVGTLERKRRRRGGRGRKQTTAPGKEAPASSPDRAEGEDEATASAESGPGAEAPARNKRRRRGGRGRKRSGQAPDPSVEADAPSDEAHSAGDAARGSEASSAEPGESSKPRKRRRRRRTGAEDDRGADGAPDEPAAGQAAEGETAPGGRKKLRRRRSTSGGRRGRSGGEAVALEAIPGEADEALPELPEDSEEIASGKKKRRRRPRKRREAEGEVEASAEGRKAKKKAAKKASTRAKQAALPNKILVNAGDREETRVAVVRDGRIADFQMTVKKHQSLVNDIYRGRVVNLEPAIGAAFIDFGQGRNGFLHTSDVLTAYGDDDWSLDKLLTTKIDLDEWGETSQPDIGDEVDGEPAGEGDEPEAETEEDGPKRKRRGKPAAKKSSKQASKEGGGRSKRGRSRHRARPRLPITDLLEKGQSVVVQVTKDAIGDKGPTLTTYISIPGRFLVLMPSMARTGVSRKIEDEKERRRLKRILEGLEIPSGMGVIVRTAGVGATKTDLERDLDYLLLLWESFGERLSLGRGPAPLYEESDVAIRTIRDLFDEGTEAVLVDDRFVHGRVIEFTEKLMPEKLELIQLHDGPRPLFHHMGVEQDFEKIFARRVDLPSGGSIVFDQTEALVAIDVNSGKTRSDGFDFEEIALKTNLDAVPEIARQIRLRDLGGIIVCDFIDMMKMANRRAVERALRQELATDRARSKLGRISQFGLLEMTRQRLGPGLSKMLFQNCARCRGSGKVRTVESKTGAILRRLASALTLKGFSQVEVRAQPDTIAYLKGNYSKDLEALEKRYERELQLVEVPDQIEDCVLRYLRADGREVRPGGRRKR